MIFQRKEEGGIQMKPTISSNKGRRRHPNKAYHLFKMIWYKWHGMVSFVTWYHLSHGIVSFVSWYGMVSFVS